ncbi:MAG: putative glycosyltransferase [Gemmatimonadetes bacterium]|nr:putative glycosyltransferase [Gemmatimonadota bacterium]
MREIWDASFFLESVPDITHFEWSTKAAELSALLPLLEGRIVVSCRGSDVRILPLANPGLQGRLRAVFARADRVHCVARAVQQSAERYGLDASRAFVNHPSIDIERFTPRQAVTAVQPSFRILSIGRLHWVKGIEYALQAVALLVARGHDVHYRIVGPGSAEVQAQLVYTIDALALTDHVELVGPVSPTEATRELHVADAYLLSSLSEGISNAVLEAMASGVPVVSTDVGGMAEAIVHERDGLLVQAREPAAMADALERLLTDRELRTRLAANARARTEREFSIDRQIDVFEREYSNLLGGE